MIYEVSHRTDYSGSEPVSVGQNQAWLRPRDLPWQECQRYLLELAPAPSTCGERRDYFGNTVTLFSFNSGYDQLSVTARSRVEVRPRKSPDPAATPPWEQVAQQLARPLLPAALDAAQFAFDSPRAAAAAELAQYAASSFTPGRPILAGLLDLTQRIFKEFEYRPQSTTVSTPVEEVFQQRRGVCQDFAHLQLAMLRSLRLAGRYVSGYLRTIPPPGKPRLRGADASHAWLSVWCGEAGWVDVDPTNNCIPAEDHITVAWGRDYNDVPPLRGVFIGGGAHQLRVEVDVEPVDARGRPLATAEEHGEPTAEGLA